MEYSTFPRPHYKEGAVRAVDMVRHWRADRSGFYNPGDAQDFYKWAKASYGQEIEFEQSLLQRITDEDLLIPCKSVS